ncbi:MAG TPA: hypothetical protein VJI67_04095 [archaeon]|nr:hypothetical protein [archaeon]HLD80628.1 hypothetical protein [archaeon]
MTENAGEKSIDFLGFIAETPTDALKLVAGAVLVYAATYYSATSFLGLGRETIWFNLESPMWVVAPLVGYFIAYYAPKLADPEGKTIASGWLSIPLFLVAALVGFQLAIYFFHANVYQLRGAPGDFQWPDAMKTLYDNSSQGAQKGGNAFFLVVVSGVLGLVYKNALNTRLVIEK